MLQDNTSKTSSTQQIQHKALAKSHYTHVASLRELYWWVASVLVAASDGVGLWQKAARVRLHTHTAYTHNFYKKNRHTNTKLHRTADAHRRRRWGVMWRYVAEWYCPLPYTTVKRQRAGRKIMLPLPHIFTIRTKCVVCSLASMRYINHSHAQTLPCSRVYNVRIIFYAIL